MGTETKEIDDRQIGKDLTEFKRLIESNGFESGKWRERFLERKTG